jgi:hypothetical protein
VRFWGKGEGYFCGKMDAEEKKMNAVKPAVIGSVIIGLLFLAIAVVYFTQPAGSLPSFLPGHLAGSLHKHTTHGILALALGVGFFVAAWFQSGPKTSMKSP